LPELDIGRVDVGIEVLSLAKALPRTTLEEGSTPWSTTVPKDILPSPTPEIAAARKRLAPDVHDAFTAFSERVFAEGALSTKTKQLIAVAVAHVTQCPYCIRGHTRAALRHDATAAEIMEAIWVAAEMRAGGAYAHSVVALDTIEQVKGRSPGS
jgi:AhpD family alkylhydroperoxidase